MSEVILIVADKLSGYLLQESSLICGVQDEIRWLEKELRSMMCSVKYAITYKKNGDDEDDEIVNNWVSDNIDVAYDAEDIFEIFLLEARNLAPVTSFEHMLAWCSPTTSFENFFSMVGKCFPMFTWLVSHNRIGRDFIEFLKFRITEISERRATLDFGEHGGSSCRYDTLQEASRLSSQYDDDASIIVGFTEDKKNVVEKLLNDEKRLCVISIVGVGGLGKTTLAKNIFETNKVRKLFNSCFWISVSPDHKLHDLLKKMVEKVSRRKVFDHLTAEELGRALHDMLLSQGKYLIVVDGIWEKKVWYQVQKFLPDKENGSRLLITTRNKDIVRYAGPSILITPHEMSFLDEEQTRRLFLRKVYPNQNVETFPEDLKVVGQNLVEKLHAGLPLAVLLLGGFLSVIEKNQDTWSSVLKSLDWDSAAEVGACSDVLNFSYREFPDYLKPCLLYLASFPDVEEINVRRLMRLWIAEGFIPKKAGAEDYLEELVARYMVQIAGRGCDGRIKKIRIHEHVRELCRMEVRKYGFLRFEGSNVDEEEQSLPSNVESLYRLALYGSEPNRYIDLSSKNWKTPKLRTFHFRESVATDRCLSFKGLSLLRVIDVNIENSWTKLPTEICSLIHLRYLKWWSNGPGVDYQLISNLRNLQTVDVRPFLVNVDESIGDLINLQFLRDISAGMWIGMGLTKLTNLQKLQISAFKDTHWSPLIKSLKKLRLLVCLTLIWHQPITPQALPNMFSNLHALRHLTLEGALSELPNSKLAFPLNLTNLTLRLSVLEKDPMQTLKKLPNLACLKLLRSSFVGRKLCCRAGGFRKLQQLVLQDMVLEEWKVEPGALPSLIHLTIDMCDYLKKLPKGLQHVTTLQHLTLMGMPPDFTKRTAMKGSDWYKIKHVRYIHT